MFRKSKSGGKSKEANHLSFEAEPNVLSSEDGARLDLRDDPDEQEFEDFEEEPLDEEFDEEEDPEEAARQAAELEAELQRQAEEFGLTSVEPTALYGPNGADVDSLLQSLETIDIDTAELIVDAWEAVSSAERTVVRRVIQRRYSSGKLGEYAYNAEKAVDDWLLAKVGDDEDELDLWRRVAEAARDASDALVLDDKLDDVDFNTLYGPWADVMSENADAEEDGGETESAPEADETVESVKPGGRSATVVSGGDDFGPNTALVLDLFGRLDTLTPEQLTALGKAWAKTDKQALKSAHWGLDSAVKSEHDWRDQAKAAQAQIAEWASSRTWRQPAIPPLADAVAALVLADVLEAEDTATLYGPWSEVVGEPAFPVFIDAEGDGDQDDEG